MSVGEFMPYVTTTVNTRQENKLGIIRYGFQCQFELAFEWRRLFELSGDHLF